MTQLHPSNLNWQTGAPPVSRLEPVEPAALDLEVVARLHAMLGAKATGDMLSIARDDLAHRLQMVATAHADCAFDALGVSARRIRRLSVEVGLPGLRRAADHVVDCLLQEDPTALAATVARLARVGDAALKQVCEVRLPGA